MRLAFKIALRYLFSKKKHNIINVISAISVSGITFGAAALIVVLSVFNGFENLIISMFNSINPDLHISASTGKTFVLTDNQISDIKKIPGVFYLTEVIEENVLLKYKEKQHIATIKGVSDSFIKMTKIEDLMLNGSSEMKEGDVNYALIGNGIAYVLGININDFLNPLSVYVPKRGVKSYNDPLNAFNNNVIHPGGIFSVEIEYDEKYFITPIDFAKDLLNYTNELTAIEIGISDNAQPTHIKEQIQKILGNEFQIKNRFEQQEFLYKIMKTEKWAIFFILSLILLIAVFNVIGTLTMLILEKKKDIGILWTLGFNQKMLKNIFFIEGILISLSGAVFGLMLGGLICWLQQTFSLITLHSGNGFIIEAYPVLLKFKDMVLVFLTVIIIGFCAAYLPSRKINIEKIH